MNDNHTSSSPSLRALPAIDALLRTETAQALRQQVGVERLANLARAVTEEMRRELQSNLLKIEKVNGEYSRETLLDEAVRRLERVCRRASETRLRRVINASGVILHTNLGRAPLSEAARQTIAQ